MPRMKINPSAEWPHGMVEMVYAAHYNLGFAYYRRGKYDPAIESYNKALAIAHDNTLVHYNLARVYALKKKNALAIASLEKAISLDKSWIEDAQGDSDFETILSTPEFQELISPQ